MILEAMVGAAIVAAVFLAGVVVGTALAVLVWDL